MSALAYRETEQGTNFCFGKETLAVFALFPDCLATEQNPAYSGHHERATHTQQNREQGEGQPGHQAIHKEKQTTAKREKKERYWAWVTQPQHE